MLRHRNLDREGYVMSPAIKIEPVKAPSIVVMLLAPRTSPYAVATETNLLAIPNNESAIMVDTGNGELRCSGNISAKSKSARIIMNRNPGLAFYRAGFNETLSAITGPGRNCSLETGRSELRGTCCSVPSVGDSTLKVRLDELRQSITPPWRARNIKHQET
jgi:hypothetical protein